MNIAAAYSAKGFATYTPLKITIAYLGATFLLLVFGPIEYLDMPIGKTAGFLTAAATAIIVGYMFGVAARMKNPRGDPRGALAMASILFDLSLGIALFALATSIGQSIAADGLSFSLSGMGEGYLAAYEGYERNSGNYSFSFILYSISLPFSFIATVWGIYYFRRLSPLRRYLTLILIFGGLYYYVIGTGKQKQIGDLVIYILAIALVKYGVRGRRINLKTILGAVIGGFVAVLLFVAVLGQRYAALGVDSGNINQRILFRMSFDTGHPVFIIFGQDYGLSLAIFSSYLTQGYYGLGLALETDWVWTRFSGFSYSISIIADRLFGLEWQWSNTLLHRTGLATGWNESKWHTVFTYFATDFTWPGTVVLFGFFAFAYARCWLVAVSHQNPFAILLFTLLTMGMFFMPANNQLLHSPGALFTFLMVVILYLVNAGRNYSLQSIGAPKRCSGTRPLAASP